MLITHYLVKETLENGLLHFQLNIDLRYKRRTEEEEENLTFLWFDGFFSNVLSLAWNWRRSKQVNHIGRRERGSFTWRENKTKTKKSSEREMGSLFCIRHATLALPFGKKRQTAKWPHQTETETAQVYIHRCCSSLSLSLRFFFQSRKKNDNLFETLKKKKKKKKN